MKRLITLLGPVLLAAGLLAPNSAEAASRPPHVAVDIADLDLGTEKGQRILTLRIQRAARAMCKAGALESLPRNLRKQRRCISKARASAAAAADILTAARDVPSRLGS